MGAGGGAGGGSGGRCERKAGMTVSAVTCVSCQQAAAGVPKYAICERLSHAIIPCTAATDDENMLERVTPAATGREESACGRTLVYLQGPAENSRKTRWAFLVKLHCFQ